MRAPVYDFVDPVEFVNDFTLAAIGQSEESEFFAGVSSLVATDRIGLDLSAVVPAVVIHVDAAYPTDNFREGGGAQVEVEWQVVVSGVDMVEPASGLAVRLLRALSWATRNGTTTSQGVVKEMEVTSLPVPVLGLPDPTLVSYVVGATLTVQKRSDYGIA